MNDDLSLSADGLDFIAAHEGFSATPYRDGAGQETIGYGHRLAAGEQSPEAISADAARRLLAEDAARAEQAVRARVTEELTQAEFDALVSFAFNVGAGAFARSTLLAKLNDGDFDGAGEQFSRWDKIRVGGKPTVSPGLAKRRADERRLFLDGLYGPSAPRDA
jgi:lysozyme